MSIVNIYNAGSLNIICKNAGKQLLLFHVAIELEFDFLEICLKKFVFINIFPMVVLSCEVMNASPMYMPSQVHVL